MSVKIKNNIFLKFLPVVIGIVIFLKEIESVHTHSVETKYIQVPVDHFSPTEPAKTFNLRYLVYAKNHIKGGPVFVYTGGERDITVAARHTGFLFDIAPTFNAMIVFIEHRYYGRSLPFGNTSFASLENLRYCMSTQALSDFAYLLNDLKKNLSDTSHATGPFIAFGGYYAGTLSALLRLRYPDLIKGAITSSAPMFYLPGSTSCEDYYKIATRVFMKYGEERCVRTIKLAWEIIISISKTKKGMDFISSSLKLCKDLETPEDVEVLLDWLAETYVKLSMVNYPYSSDYYNPVPANPVLVFCNKLNTAHFNDTRQFIEMFAAALKIYTNYTGKAICTDIFYKQHNANELAWQYQTCTELIMPKCSTDYDMFITKNWNYEDMSLDCYRKYNIKPRPNWAFSTYGGQNLHYYSNVVFSSSMLDPASYNAVYLNKSDDKSKQPWISYRIEEAPHLMEFRTSDRTDNSYIIKARNFYVSTIKNWLNQK
ncbi:unnamed protein product [Psylliodes chrysocephalus]|uniref:Lysosomal Pro-X carboxypeptidase n=1 Tax=Psylliodes chrysocephalus TaxID=3402493 RepID=A0A9P0CVS6_9CUCU|nr:unnamed protein product [Psylliodes chrysocephala]